MGPMVDNDTRTANIILQSDPYISCWKRKQAQIKGMSSYWGKIIKFYTRGKNNRKTIFQNWISFRGKLCAGQKYFIKPIWLNHM